MATTRKHSPSINDRKRARAEQGVREVLEGLALARRGAAKLDDKMGGGNRAWTCLSARKADEEPLIHLLDRKLLVYGLSEIEVASKRILWRTGFISGAQSDSDEKPSEEEDF